VVPIPVVDRVDAFLFSSSKTRLSAEGDINVLICLIDAFMRKLKKSGFEKMGEVETPGEIFPQTPQYLYVYLTYAPKTFFG
jgi:hypothetical protein